MTDDLRDRLADALAYSPASSAYDYADRVLPLVRANAAAELFAMADRLTKSHDHGPARRLRNRANKLLGPSRPQS